MSADIVIGCYCQHKAMGQPCSGSSGLVASEGDRPAVEDDLELFHWPHLTDLVLKAGRKSRFELDLLR